MTALVKNIIGAKQSPAAAPNPADQKASGETGVPHAAIQFITVDAESAGQRLDNFLFRHLKGVPKTHVYRIIRSGEVRVNKGRVQADTRLEAGDVVRLPPVRISARAQEGATPPAPAREFPVLLEDEHLLAIDKPAGVAVHGGSGVSFGVIEQLRTARPGRQVPGTGAPAGPRDLRHPAGGQEAQRAGGAAGPVPRTRDRQDLSGAGRRRLARQQEGARRAAWPSTSCPTVRAPVPASAACAWSPRTTRTPCAP